MEGNYFSELYKINVSEKIEKKNGLSYLSWAWAWAELKKVHPDAVYTIYENKDGWNYHTDGKTGWVKTGLTVAKTEHIEYLPIMNNRNQSINFDSITSCDVNKTIQRSLTKAIGRHGLGLSLYVGEDLPEENKKEVKDKLFDDIEYQLLSKALRDYIEGNYFDHPENVEKVCADKNIDGMRKALAVAKANEATR